MRTLLVSGLLLFLAAPVWGANKTVILFLDGARVEQDLAVRKGFLEIPLPEGVLPNSLRVKPLDGREIARVEVAPPKREGQAAREQARLVDRRERLLARLKALDTREEIFKAAAKSQSGKAPKKTKANPEPLVTIRRGTDFALSQLEEVYRIRLQSERELQEVDTHLAALAKGGTIGRSVARVWLKSGEGKVMVSYLLPELAWKPFYDFRLAGNGRVLVSQRAVLPPMEKGVELSVMPSSSNVPAGTDTRLTPEKGNAGIAEYAFSTGREELAPVSPSALTFTFRNDSPRGLPAGDAACFQRGEYLGRIHFPGILAGETREVVCGR